MIPADQKLSYQELELQLQSANEQLARYKAAEAELPPNPFTYQRSQLHIIMVAKADYDTLRTFVIAQVAGRKAAEKDAARIDGVAAMLKACPHTVITWNDDPDAEDDFSMIPLGFSIRIDGCQPLIVAGENIRTAIDAAIKAEGEMK